MIDFFDGHVTPRCLKGIEQREAFYVPVDDWKCVEGTKVDRIDPDSGKTYRQVCHADGKITVDAPIRPSCRCCGPRASRRTADEVRANDHGSMPAEECADKSQKILVAIYGFGSSDTRSLLHRM